MNFLNTPRYLRIPVLGTQVRLAGRDWSSVDFYPELRGRLVRGENSPVTNYTKPRGSILNLGKLFDGFFKHELVDGPGGILLSRRVVTDAGVAFLVDDWADDSQNITNFNAHANGTGTDAEGTGDTALLAEVGDRQAGVKSQPTANQLRTVATIAQAATHAITEHGILDSTTVAGSTLWDRSLFAAINVQAGDSIEFTYTLTVNSGG